MYEKTNTGAVKKYYTAFGRTIAIRDVPTGSGAGTMYYPVPDHLGSTSTILDASGNTVSSQHYWPYGATRSGGVTQTDRLYTGQRQEPGDAAMGLYNYKARFYSTTLGRFVSADPITQETQHLNRYAYALSNPVRWADPTGFVPGCAGCLNDGYEESRWVDCARGPTECSLGPYPELVPRLHWIAQYSDLIGAQASFWGVDPAAVLAILRIESVKGFWQVVHEGNGRAIAAELGDEAFWAYAKLDEPDYGLGNVTVSALMELEASGFPRLGDTVYERIVALDDAPTNIMVVAALLAHYQQLTSPLLDPQTRTEHAMLMYTAGSRVYREDWKKGSIWAGPVRGADGLYRADPISGDGSRAAASINRFLTVIDQARITSSYCQTASGC